MRGASIALAIALGALAGAAVEKKTRPALPHLERPLTVPEWMVREARERGEM